MSVRPRTEAKKKRRLVAEAEHRATPDPQRSRGNTDLQLSEATGGGEARKPGESGATPRKDSAEACETPPKPSPVHPPHGAFFPSKLPIKSHSWPRAAIHSTSASILAAHGSQCWGSAIVSVPLGRRITGMRATLTPSRNYSVNTRTPPYAPGTGTAPDLYRW